MTSSTVV